MPGRVDANELLLQPIRSDLFDALTAHGPLTLAELTHQCPCSTSTILWHARKLEAAGIIERDTTTPGRRYRVVATNQAKVASAMRLLHSRAARGVVERALQSPGSDILGAVGPNEVTHELATRLQAEGLIELHDWDGTKRIYATRLAEQLARFARVAPELP